MDLAADSQGCDGLRVRQMNRVARNMTPLASLEVSLSPPEPLQDELSILRFGTGSDTFIA